MTKIQRIYDTIGEEAASVNMTDITEAATAHCVSWQPITFCVRHVNNEHGVLLTGLALLTLQYTN